MFLVSSCSCVCPIHWSQVLSQEWRCSWSSIDRRCSNYIWVINKFIVYAGAAYIRGLTVYEKNLCNHDIDAELSHNCGDVLIPEKNTWSINDLVFESSTCIEYGMICKISTNTGNMIYLVTRSLRLNFCLCITVCMLSWCNIQPCDPASMRHCQETQWEAEPWGPISSSHPGQNGCCFADDIIRCI